MTIMLSDQTVISMAAKKVTLNSIIVEFQHATNDILYPYFLTN